MLTPHYDIWKCLPLLALKGIAIFALTQNQQLWPLHHYNLYLFSAMIKHHIPPKYRNSKIKKKCNVS